MYEYHGWVTIRETPTCDDEKNLELKILKIKEFIRNLQWCNGVLRLHAVNGEYLVIVSGLTNHKSQEANDLLNLYSYIAEEASGSYGLLHIWDDEDKSGLDNKFQVYVLVRGQVTLREDPFLSPCIPVIEDECL